MLLPPAAAASIALEEIVTVRHIDLMGKVILATGSIVGYAYGMEFFIAWYGANPYEGFAFINRAFGHYAWAYWIMIGCNVVHLPTVKTHVYTTMTGAMKSDSQ